MIIIFGFEIRWIKSLLSGFESRRKRSKTKLSLSRQKKKLETRVEEFFEIPSKKFSKNFNWCKTIPCITIIIFLLFAFFCFFGPTTWLKKKFNWKCNRLYKNMFWISIYLAVHLNFLGFVQNGNEKSFFPLKKGFRELVKISYFVKSSRASDEKKMKQNFSNEENLCFPNFHTGYTL